MNMFANKLGLENAGFIDYCFVYLISLMFRYMLQAKLDQTVGWRRLLFSDGWGDSGLYVNNQYQVFPRSTNIRCKEKIRVSRYYKYGITRTPQGDVTLYLNGGICVSGKPGVSENLALDPKNVVFFHDDGSENPSGEVMY